jgi:hypothetical protein
MQQGREEVDEEAGRDRAAQDQVDHGAVLLPFAEKDVGDQRGETGRAQRKKSGVSHACSPRGLRKA